MLHTKNHKDKLNVSVGYINNTSDTICKKLKLKI